MSGRHRASDRSRNQRGCAHRTRRSAATTSTSTPWTSSSEMSRDRCAPRTGTRRIPWESSGRIPIRVGSDRRLVARPIRCALHTNLGSDCLLPRGNPMATKKYNPGFLSDDELVESFCVRTSEFESIIETLRENTGNSNQHLIVIGPRGSGKTSLLLRVAIEARRNPELSSRDLPHHVRGGELRGQHVRGVLAGVPFPSGRSGPCNRTGRQAWGAPTRICVTIQDDRDACRSLPGRLA